MYRYNIVTRDSKQLISPQGNCEANDNDVERYYVEIEPGG